MKSRCIHICILLCLYVYNLYGQTPDDNIIITKCSDSYIFEEKDGIPIVSNRKEISYEATRMGASLQPHTYYGEFISLDKASAKGGGKAEYKSITPENVFFDDSKVCFFNLYLDRKGKNRSIVQAHFSRPALFYAGLPGRRLLHQRKATDIHHPAIAFPLPPDGKKLQSGHSL